MVVERGLGGAPAALRRWRCCYRCYCRGRGRGCCRLERQDADAVAAPGAGVVIVVVGGGGGGGWCCRQRWCRGRGRVGCCAQLGHGTVAGVGLGREDVVRVAPLVVA